jgi:hypothetical protein
VLEVGGEEEVGEGGGIEDEEGVAGAAPAHDGVRGGIADHVERLRHERRDCARAAAVVVLELVAIELAAHERS